MEERRLARLCSLSQPLQHRQKHQHHFQHGQRAAGYQPTAQTAAAAALLPGPTLAGESVPTWLIRGHGHGGADRVNKRQQEHTGRDLAMESCKMEDTDVPRR